MNAPDSMSTYYLLDANSNTWSRKHVPLRAILAMPGVTDGHLLADAQTRQTLTVAEACAACRKPRLKTPDAGGLLRWNKAATSAVPTARPGAAEDAAKRSAAAAPEKKSSRSREYMVLDRSDCCFGGRVNAATLANALNTYASQGWKVLSCHFGNVHSTPDEAWEELLIIMERSV